MSFIFRIIKFLFYFAVYAALFGLAVFIVSRAIQEVGKWMGYEVGSLLDWLKSIIPKIKKKKKK